MPQGETGNDVKTKADETVLGRLIKTKTWIQWLLGAGALDLQLAEGQGEERRHTTSNQLHHKHFPQTAKGERRGHRAMSATYTRRTTIYETYEEETP